MTEKIPPPLTGRQLRAVREYLGLSQAGFAHHCGVSRSTIDSYETGRYAPSPETQAAIANAVRNTPGVSWRRRSIVLKP